MSLTYFAVDREEVLRKLRDALRRDRRILIAVVFGSVLSSEHVRDVDIGLVTHPPLTLKELLVLAGRLELLIGVPVDLLPITEVPPKLQYKMLASGKPLIIRDKELYNKLTAFALGQLQDIEIKIRKLS
ncbi:MAG: nucleotidyltransferase domain-containing protein [Desulfurococcales archaeon]|nr:nucleotidyltransferase domain-containing protein [Desulfurococcales archaeon]